MRQPLQQKHGTTVTDEIVLLQILLLGALAVGFEQGGGVVLQRGG